MTSGRVGGAGRARGVGGVASTGDRRAQSRHAPTELSSSKPVPFVGRAATVGDDGLGGEHGQRGKRRGRGFDPRFEEMCGSFDERAFRRQYEFVGQMREKEKEELKRAALNQRDPEAREALQKNLQQMEDQDRAQAWERKKQQIKASISAKEREQVKKGKKPFYLKKSALKEIELKAKYEELKKQGNLKKYIEKRRKKQASRDKRLIPRQRGEAEEY